ncbi:hypothetical protein NEUTE2DRAFT_128176 [Neurospora tetrasperma FGSC 2509]|nr:hypothetical protein NEUTE2DRAFT_128176 [Neurospora tetrasperma FGSC 2509]
MHVPGHGLWAMRRHWSSFALTNLGKKEAHKRGDPAGEKLKQNLEQGEFWDLGNISTSVEQGDHQPQDLVRSSAPYNRRGKSFEPSFGRTASGHAVNVSQSVMANWWEEAILRNFDAKTLYGAKKGSFGQPTFGHVKVGLQMYIRTAASGLPASTGTALQCVSG